MKIHLLHRFLRRLSDRHLPKLVGRVHIPHKVDIESVVMVKQRMTAQNLHGLRVIIESPVLPVPVTVADRGNLRSTFS